MLTKIHGYRRYCKFACKRFCWSRHGCSHFRRGMMKLDICVFFCLAWKRAEVSENLFVGLLFTFYLSFACLHENEHSFFHYRMLGHRHIPTTNYLHFILFNLLSLSLIRSIIIVVIGSRCMTMPLFNLNRGIFLITKR